MVISYISTCKLIFCILYIYIYNLTNYIVTVTRNLLQVVIEKLLESEGLTRSVRGKLEDNVEPSDDIIVESKRDEEVLSNDFTNEVQQPRTLR